MSISLHGPDYLVDEDAVGVVLDGVWYMKYIWSAEPSILTLTFSIPVLVTNLVSTTLVGLQVW